MPEAVFGSFWFCKMLDIVIKHRQGWAQDQDGGHELDQTLMPHKIVVHRAIWTHNLSITSIVLQVSPSHQKSITSLLPAHDSPTAPCSVGSITIMRPYYIPSLHTNSLDG